MIKKEFTMDGKNYLLGFKEINSMSGSLIECHILEHKFLKDVSIFKKDHWKTLFPDYWYIALCTVLDYESEIKQKEQLLVANWT